MRLGSRYRGPAALLLALFATVAAAGPAELTPDQMRVFGHEALVHGFADQALTIAEALLARDPADVAAWLMKADALRVMNRLAESEAAARQGWRLARNPGEKFAAATAMAQALSLQDHRTRAQFWLRQAAQSAPSPEARAQAQRDFDYVRAQNPLTLRVNLSAQPSSNVNGGTAVKSVDLGGLTFPLPGYLQALSGLSWGSSVNGSYTLTASPEAETALTFGLGLQGVVLSDAARALAPSVTNGDYLLGHVEAGIQRQMQSKLGYLTLSASAGRNWYGGQPLSDTLGGDVSLQQPLGKGVLTWSAGVTRQMRLDDAASSSTDVTGGVAMRQAGPKGDMWSAGLEMTRAISAADAVDHAGLSLSLGWKAAQPLAGMALSADLTLEGKRFDGNGRADGGWSAGLTATLDQISYLGFAPVLSVKLAQNQSNFILYRTQQVEIGLSIASRF